MGTSHGFVCWFGKLTPDGALTACVLLLQLVLLWRTFRLARDVEVRSQRHDRLSMQPYLDFQTSGGNGKIKVVLENHGTGPAVNVVLQVVVDGKNVEPNRWEDWPAPLLTALGIKQYDLMVGAGQKGYLTMPSATLRPAGTIDVIDFNLRPGVDLTKLRSRLRLSVTYQSIYRDEDGIFSAEMVWPAKDPA